MSQSKIPTQPQQKRWTYGLCFIVLSWLAPAILSATTINVGVLSFDNLIPDGASPGVNVFDIANFTGETWSLPPDFPVADEVTLQNAVLTLEGDLGTQEIDLGDIVPGIFTPPDSLEFSDTVNFTSATLTATLGESSINLYDGTAFAPSSETLVATLLPSSGSDLTASTDFAVISASGALPVTTTPEPATWLLSFAPLSIAFKVRNSLRRRFRQVASRSLSQLWCLPAITIAILLFSTLVQAQTTSVTLSPAPSPTAGQPGITVINLTGTGFPSGTIQPASLTVSLALATGGGTVATTASSVTTIAGTTRRITFTIPGSISVTAPTAYSVSIAGTTTTNVAFSSSNTANLTINPAPAVLVVSPPGGIPGQSLNVSVTGTNTNFVQSSTSVDFGAGITVANFSVVNPSSLTMTLTTSGSAVPGPRQVTVTTGTQVASLPNGFTIFANPASNVSYTYDSQGRIATATYTTTSGPRTVAYSYDNAGNRISIVTH